jgi:hypothetical protein
MLASNLPKPDILFELYRREKESIARHTKVENNVSVSVEFNRKKRCINQRIYFTRKQPPPPQTKQKKINKNKLTMPSPSNASIA